MRLCYLYLQRLKGQTNEIGLNIVCAGCKSGIQTRIVTWLGRYALVTGAGYGIGSEICRGLTQHGIHVIGCGRSVDKITALAAEIAGAGHSGVLHPYKCDLTKEPEIAAMFEWITSKFGGVDICINNAGISFGEPIIGCSVEKMKQMLDLNVVAVLSCDNKAIASMQARGVDDGHIIHINSMLGHYVKPMDASHSYGATKYAITQINEALRQELLGRGSRIRVTAISPSLVDTDFVSHAYGEAIREKVTKDMPSLKPKDVADSLIFALSAPETVQIHDIQLRATGAN